MRVRVHRLRKICSTRPHDSALAKRARGVYSSLSVPNAIGHVASLEAISFRLANRRTLKSPIEYCAICR